MRGKILRFSTLSFCAAHGMRRRQGHWINAYIQIILMFIGINIILSTSLNLINGYMGEFSVGHAGFMAVGAYITSVLNVCVFTSSSVFGPAFFLLPAPSCLFPLTLLVGGIGAALAGLLVAVPSFRTRGDYLAIITLAVNYIVKSSHREHAGDRRAPAASWA